MSPWFAVAMCIWFWVALASQALIGHWQIAARRNP